MTVAVVVAVGGWLLLSEACDPSGAYTRVSPGSGGDIGGGGTGEVAGGSGGVTGSGGIIAASGGVSGGNTGGVGGSVGGAAGGRGGTSAGGAAGHGSGGTGGSPSGGAGGRGATGGGGVGGAVTSSGGAAGGQPGTGGAGTGGAAGTVGSGGAGGSTGGGPGGSTASGGAGGGPQRIVSIDFVGAVVASGGAITSTMPMAATETAGVKPATHWNEAAGAASSAAMTPLVQADGTDLTGSSVTWTASTTSTSPGVYSVGLTDAPGDARMMNGYLDPANGTAPVATVVVDGLGALTGGYDVYVYFMAKLASGETRTHKLAIGTASVTVSQTGPSPTAFAGYGLATSTTGNYVVFKNVSGTTFTLTATAVSGTTMRAPVNGMQIVWPSGS